MSRADPAPAVVEPVVTVRLRIEPRGLALLHCWGRAADGWWGYVSWVLHVRVETASVHGPAGRRCELVCTGWVAAGDLEPWGTEPVPAVRRIVLLRDPRRWPAPVPPTRWQDLCSYYGQLRGQRLPPTPGVTTV